MISFQILGMMTCVFAVSVLLLNTRTSLEEKESKPKVRKLLTVCCILLWVLSLPVSVIAYFLHQPSSNRYAKLKNKLKVLDLSISSSDKLIRSLESENNRLKDQLADYRSDNNDSRYVSGLRAGSKDGFVAGYEQCLSERGISPNPDYAVHYINEAYSYSKQRVNNYANAADILE